MVNVLENQNQVCCQVRFHIQRICFGVLGNLKKVKDKKQVKKHKYKILLLYYYYYY